MKILNVVNAALVVVITIFIIGMLKGIHDSVLKYQSATCWEKTKREECWK